MQHAPRGLFCVAKPIASGCANEGRFFWSGQTEFGIPMFRQIASKESWNNTSSANNLMKNGFSKGHHLRQPLTPLQAKFDSNKFSKILAKGPIHAQGREVPSKRSLKFSLNSKQRNSNYCHFTLQHHASTACGPSNYDENLKRQLMSACLEASIWHLQQRSDPQIQPLKTALNQSPTPAKLSCSAPCQQSSPS